MRKDEGSVVEIYREFETWEVNVGQKTIHAKRMPGFFRSLKHWLQFGLWLPFFFLPYLRWNDRQAILFDLEHSRFHFFGLTVFPDDIWVLALLLLAAAMVLFAVTAIISRAWCGYFCFQTAWTDWFTWIEAKIEGNPAARRKLDQAPWSVDKFRKKALKHLIWMAISLFTGISFSIWFTDAYVYWQHLVTFHLPTAAWVVLKMFFLGTYLLAGFMREQACFWLCPYARIQGVMADAGTILPTYDVRRGEPRGKLQRNLEGQPTQGDCIDCFQCVQVCPTGVDIRQGQQLGCITCGLCLDACDSVMDKIGKPRGLIRYASHREMEDGPCQTLGQRPLVLGYLFIILLSVFGIGYGLLNIAPITVSVRPERQPLFVQMSDGAIQNRYDFKVMNKTNRDRLFKINALEGVKGQIVIGAEQALFVPKHHAMSFTLFVRVPFGLLDRAVTQIRFVVTAIDDPVISAERVTQFNAPKP